VKKLKNERQRNAHLDRARKKWVATSKADAVWKALVGILDVAVEHRPTVVDRLRTQVEKERKACLTPVVNSIARLSKRRA
jgi:hypothetical protein